MIVSGIYSFTTTLMEFIVKYLGIIWNKEKLMHEWYQPVSQSQIS